jgi:hypothetical protein
MIILRSSFQLLVDVDDPFVTRSLIYQGFIYPIVRGKYKDIADYDWNKYFLEEKVILRRIAALRQMHYPNVLTKSMVIEGLNYGLAYDEKLLRYFGAHPNFLLLFSECIKS